jgi:hypothetical protein
MNIGTSVSFWIMLLKAVVFIALLVKMGFIIYAYIKAEKWNKYGKLVAWALITIFVAILMFAGYGRGRVDLQSVTGDEVGMTKLQKEAGPENIDSVRQVTEEEKPEALKRQEDAGFDNEAKQADEYLKSIGVE